MDRIFSPDRFWEELYRGAFEGRLDEELRSLSAEEREALAILMTERLARTGDLEVLCRHVQHFSAD